MDFEKVTEALSSVAESVVERAKALKRQQDLIKEALEAVRREPPNVARLHRVLTSPDRAALAAEFPESDEPLAELERWGEPEWNDLFLDYASRFRVLAADACFEVQGEAPNFTVGRGIAVAFDPSRNQTVVDGQKLPSIDVHEALESVRARDVRLWDLGFDVEAFAAQVYDAFKALTDAEEAVDTAVRILKLYEQFKSSLPEAERKRFAPDVFAAGLSRILEDGVRTIDGRVLVLSPVADPRDAMWVWLPDRKASVHRGLVAFKETPHE